MLAYLVEIIDYETAKQFTINNHIYEKPICMKKYTLSFHRILPRTTINLNLIQTKMIIIQLTNTH